ncbi:MAG TPA: porin, partial [Vicinamibacterales bacterium]|nr:porin [Vicinamibacterales bacterium]
FAGGSAQLLDAYFDIRFSNAFRIRSGKDKTPVGYELLLGDTTLIFPERSVVSLLVPNRDVGFQVLGEVAGGKVLYQGGIFNGQPVDGASSTTDADANDSKDVAGRIVVLPFKSTTTPASLLNNFGFHLGASTGDQTGPLPSFRTSVGQAVFNYASATADGRRNRITPAVFIYTQGLGAYAEYARTRQDIIIRNEERTTIVNHAWQVTASYVLTGEAASDRGVKPRAPFDPAAGHWGALQVAARYGELTLDDAIFASGIAGPNAIRRARQVTATIDWFLTNYIKIYGAFERFTFNEGSRDAEHSVIFRTQLAF